MLNNVDDGFNLQLDDQLSKLIDDLERTQSTGEFTNKNDNMSIKQSRNNQKMKAEKFTEELEVTTYIEDILLTEELINPEYDHYDDNNDISKVAK